MESHQTLASGVNLWYNMVSEIMDFDGRDSEDSMRKCLTILLAAMLIVACGIAVRASDVIETGDFLYTVNRDTRKEGKNCTIVGYIGEDTEVVIPAVHAGYEVTMIGVLDGMENVEKLTLPGSVTKILSGAFSDCPALTMIDFDGTLKEWCGIIFEDESASPTIRCKALYIGGQKITELDLENGITGIHAYAFAGCADLVSVTLPDTLVSIGAQAFRNCTGLAFINIPDMTVSVESLAFGGCTALESVWIGSNLAYLAEDAFRGCAKLSEFDISGFNRNFIHKDGMILSKDGKTLYMAGEGFGSEYLNIPYGVERIAGYAFYDNQMLQKVTLPDTVRSIGECAFYGCHNLTEFYMSDSVQKLGSRAFAYTGLKSIDLSDNITEIPVWAFGWSTSLAEVHLPDNLRTIACLAFAYCDMTDITIPPNIEGIGRSAFLECDKLKTAHFLGNAPSEWGTYIGTSSSPALRKWALPEGTVIYYNYEGYGWETSLSGFNIWAAPCGSCSYKAYAYEPDTALYSEILIRPMEELKPDPKKYIMTLVEYGTGTPVSGAFIALGDTELQTNAAGKAIFDMPEEDSVALLIRAAGYADFTVEEYSGYRRAAADTVEMIPEGATEIQPVSCNDTLISTGTAQLNINADLTAEIVIHGIAPVAVEKYELKQQNRILGESTTGVFSIHNSNFIKGTPVTAIMYTSDGEETSKILNINVVEFSFNGNVFSVSDLSLKLPESTPLLAGLELEAGIANLVKQKVQITNDEIRVGINVDVTDEMKPKLDQIVRKQFEKFGNSKFYKGLRFEIGGYFIVQVDNNGVLDKSGEVYVAAKLQKDFGVDLHVPLPFITIPVRLEVEISGEGQLRITGFDYDFGKAKFEFPELQLLLAAGLTGRAGFGVAALSAGLYGKLEIEFLLRILPDTAIDKITGRGEFGFYAKADAGFLEFEGKAPVASGELVFYDSDKSYTTKQASAFSLYDSSAYTLSSREYLTARSAWDGAAQTLQSSVYNGADPVLVRAGDTVMMMFLDDNGRDDANNFQQLVFSVLTDAGWSSPVPVDDNYLADAEFSLYSDGNAIYVSYSEANRLYTDEEETEAYTAAMEIHTAVYDPDSGSFTGHCVLTADSLYDTKSCISVIGGVPMTAWIKQADSDVLGMSESNTVYLSRWENGAWTAPQVIADSVPAAASLSLGSFDGATAEIAVILDGDSNFETADDHVMTLYRADGTVKSYAESDAVSVKFAENVLYWHQDGSIMAAYESGGSAEAIASLSADTAVDFQVLADGDERAVMLRVHNTEGENGSSAIHLLRLIDGEWSLPVRMTHTDGYVDSCSGLLDGDGILTVYRHTHVTFGEETFDTVSDLCWDNLVFAESLEILDVEYDYEDLMDGDTLSLTLHVRNNGAAPSRGVMVLIGNDFSESVSRRIPAGASAEIPVVYPMPENPDTEIVIEVYRLQTSSVYAATASEDVLQDSESIRLGYADFSVTAVRKIITGTPYLSISVTNSGSITGTGTLGIRENDSAGGIIYLDDITLEPGGTRHIQLALLSGQMSDFYHSGIEKLYLELVPESPELNLSDNHTSCSMFYSIDADEEALEKAHRIELDVVKTVPGSADAVYCDQVLYALYEKLWDTPGTDMVTIEVVRKSGTIFEITYKQGYRTLVAERNIQFFGDVNGDGWTDSADGKHMSRYFAGQITADEINLELATADINGDGSVTRADGMALTRAAAGWQECTGYFG